MFRARRARAREEIRARCGDRYACSRGQCQRHWVRRHPDAHRVESGGDAIDDASVSWHDEGEWTGPERSSQRFGGCRQLTRDLPDGCHVGDVDDEWVACGAALYREDPSHRGGLRGIDAQPVHGLGGKGHEAACSKALCCSSDHGRIRSCAVDAKDLGHPASVYFGYADRMQPALPFERPDQRPKAEPASYFVRQRRARRYLLRVEPDGRVRVTIPRGGSKREAEAFLARQREWVDRQRARIGSRSPAFSDAERDRLRVRAATELPAELQALAASRGLHVERVSIRNQRSRWGSCGRDGHITLNWRLVAMPAWVRQYVLVHELMHLRQLDHSPAYWSLVAEAYPEYRQARAWLRVNGPALL